MSSSVRVWGCGACFQSRKGNVPFTDENAVIDITSIHNADVVSHDTQHDQSLMIACGGNHTLIAINDARDSSIYTFGTGKSGQLGIGSTANRKRPTKIVLDKAPLKIRAKISSNTQRKSIMAEETNCAQCDRRVQGLACGARHSIVWTADEVYGFGSNYFGQLGYDYNEEAHAKDVLRPRPIPNLVASHRVSSCAAGERHTLIVLEDGNVLGMGSNESGQLGLGQRPESPVPVAVPLSCVVDVACGQTHSIAVTDDGAIFQMGGKSGLGRKQELHTPQLVETLSPFMMKKVACGANHCLALSADGKCYAWGDGRKGQLGKKVYNSQSPIIVQIPEPDSSIAVISGAENFSAVVTILGKLYMFGANDDNVISGEFPEDEIIYTPYLVSGDIKDVSCGFWHAAAITGRPDLKDYDKSGGYIDTVSAEDVAALTLELPIKNKKKFEEVSELDSFNQKSYITEPMVSSLNKEQNSALSVTLSDNPSQNLYPPGSIELGEIISKRAANSKKKPYNLTQIERPKIDPSRLKKNCKNDTSNVDNKMGQKNPSRKTEPQKKTESIYFSDSTCNPMDLSENLPPSFLDQRPLKVENSKASTTIVTTLSGSKQKRKQCFEEKQKIIKNSVQQNLPEILPRSNTICDLRRKNSIINSRKNIRQRAYFSSASSWKGDDTDDILVKAEERKRKKLQSSST